MTGHHCKIAALLFLAFICPAAAESVDVEYRGEVPLDTFDCTDTTRSSFINRVCFDSEQNYLVIQLDDTYYDYCEIPEDTINELLAAPSMGEFYNEFIKGDGNGGPFDCRTHDAPEYSDLNDDRYYDPEPDDDSLNDPP